MSKSNFLKGALVLGVAGIVIKILGAMYRIPLGNLIGDQGMGYYQTAYPLYNLMFAISTSGIPIAIAKLVSEKRALGDYIGAHRVFKIAFMGLVIGGILTSACVIFGADFIVEKIGNNKAYYSMIALGPALFFVPMTSAFRGYFQGIQDMMPTAVSQVVEQLARVIVGLYLAYILLDRGLDVAAGGASFGASAGAVMGMIAIMIIYIRRRKDILRDISSSEIYKAESTKDIIKDILYIAVPITIGSSVVPLLNTIDVAIVMRRLQLIGYTEAEASGLYGQLTGMAQTLINFPQIFSIALAVSLVPAISDARARKNYNQLKRIASSGIRVTLLIGLPAAMGLFILATPIMKLLYFNNPLEVQQSAGSILAVLSFSVIFLTMVQTLTAILQGIGKPIIPVFNLLIGASVKLILTYVLTVIPAIGIKGAAISTIMAYLIASILNFIYVKKHIRVSFSFIDIIIKPLISVLIMSGAVFLLYKSLDSVIGENVSTILSVLIGAIIYGVLLILTGCVKKSDLDIVPAGEKISKILKIKN